MVELFEWCQQAIVAGLPTSSHRVSGVRVGPTVIILTSTIVIRLGGRCKGGGMKE